MPPTILTLSELERSVRVDLGRTDWRDVDQETVALFARATGDDQWIHVDPERSFHGPFGGTVAHGYLTLSLLPSFLSELMSVSDGDLMVNYGIDKLRFPAPVGVGSRIRLRAAIAGAERRDAGVVCRLVVAVEIEGQERPGLAGEVLFLAAPSQPPVRSGHGVGSH